MHAVLGALTARTGSTTRQVLLMMSAAVCDGESAHPQRAYTQRPTIAEDCNPYAWQTTKLESQILVRLTSGSPSTFLYRAGTSRTWQGHYLFRTRKRISTSASERLVPGH